MGDRYGLYTAARVPSSLSRFNFKSIGLSLLIGLVVLLSSVAAGWTQDPGGVLGWRSYGSVGDIVYAPIQLDGRHLFSIAAERTKEKEGGGQRGLSQLQVRRTRIENRLQSQLQYLIQHGIKPESLQVITTQLNQQMAVQAVIDGKATKPIVTVTALDAEIYGLSEPEVAEAYAKRIQEALLQGLQERQPDAQRSQGQWAVLTGAIATLMMALLFWGQQRIGQVRRQLRRQFHDRQGALLGQQLPISQDIDITQNASDHQQHLFELKRRIEHKTWQKRILQLLGIVVGVVGLAWILQRFPQTRSLGIALFRQPIGLLLIWLAIALTTTLSRLLIDWVLSQWVGREETTPLAQIERRCKRVPTLSAVWKSVLTSLLIGLGIVLSYGLLSLSSGLTLVTEIGVLGVAISLAFQSSIKDALSGWMLLARDAYTVGDIVIVKGETGVVEEMGLFITQIRSSPGNLITLRNGEITTVSNFSKGWASMDFAVRVDYATDLKPALKVMQAVLQTMQTDPEWGPQLLGEPDILGVDQFEPDGIVLKIRTQTQPGQQFGVTREFRLRLNQAFQQAGIKIALPQREVRYRAGGDPTHPGPSALG